MVQMGGKFRESPDSRTAHPHTSSLTESDLARASSRRRPRAIVLWFASILQLTRSAEPPHPAGALNSNGAFTSCATNGFVHAWCVSLGCSCRVLLTQPIYVRAELAIPSNSSAKHILGQSVRYVVSRFRATRPSRRSRKVPARIRRCACAPFLINPSIAPGPRKYPRAIRTRGAGPFQRHLNDTAPASKSCRVHSLTCPLRSNRQRRAVRTGVRIQVHLCRSSKFLSGTL
ncbi:hypothetical protein B0H17DRAFT_1096590 [Mycena rosella]|uniref:Uncharacterized protein n=1 Tax=Mycena rosella TaxID=1033263 RepID=A0AAD7CRQ2_MYCRO|nr:hypothetical protein B0H17DRAFT_1096590 [Mycena rosella]